MEKKRKQVTLFFLLNHPYTRRVEDVQLECFSRRIFWEKLCQFFFYFPCIPPNLGERFLQTKRKFRDLISPLPFFSFMFLILGSKQRKLG
jgi:hypothetical protein